MKRILLLILFVINLSLYSQRSIPDLVLPAFGEIVYSDTVLMRWNLACNDSLQYISISSDSVFSNIILSSTLIGNEFNFVPNRNRKYYWKIRTGNKFTNPSFFEVINPRFIGNIQFFLTSEAKNALYTNGSITGWKDNSQQFDASITSNYPAPEIKRSLRYGSYLSFNQQCFKLDIPSSTTNTFMFLLQPIESPTSVFKIFMGCYNTNVQGVRWAFGYSVFDNNYGIGWGGTNGSTGLGSAGSIVLNQFNLLTFVKSASNWQIFVNGVLKNTVSDNSFPQQPGNGSWILGGENSLTGTNPLPLAFNLKTMAVFGKNLNDAERQSMERMFLSQLNKPANLGIDSYVNDTLQLSGYTAIRWSTGDTSGYIVPKISGNYWATATKNDGSFTSDTILVLNALNTNKPNTNALCTNDTIIWDTKLNKNQYSFIWNNNSSLSDSILKISSLGSYFLTIKNNITKCTETQKLIIQTLVGNNLPSLADLGDDKSECYGTKLRLKTGNAFIQSYLWNSGSVIDFTIITTSGKYSVLLKSYNGCRYKDSINVTLLNATAPNVDFYISPLCDYQNAKLFDVSNLYGNSISNSELRIDNNIVPLFSLIFSTPGITSITYSITTSGNCSNFLTKQFEINPSPKSKFINTQVCTNDTMNFANTSTINSGTITSNFWRWSNGINLNVKNPKVLFNQPGTYSTTLTSISAKGCVSQPFIKSYIVKGGIKADFNYSDECVGRPVYFNESTIYPDSLAGTFRQWEFNGSTISGAINTGTLYNTAGLFPVKLSVTASNGCKSTVSKLVKVRAFPKLDFETGPLCQFSNINIINKSTVTLDSISSYSWDFGNGKTSMLKNPVISYSDTSTFKITLKASNGQCVSEVSKSVKIFLNPKAAFVPLNQDIDADSSPTLFVLNTSLGINYLWKFNDLITTSGANPKIVLPNGYYKLKLIITNQVGCKDSITGIVNSNQPDINLALKGIGSTFDNENSIQLGLRISNIGNRNIDSISVLTSLPDNIQINQMWYGHLKKGIDSTIILNQKVKIKSKKADYYCVRIQAINETDLSNNEACEVLTNAIVMYDLVPNPTSAGSEVIIAVPENCTIDMKVYDANSKLVIQKSTSYINQGVYVFDLESETLSAGLYFVNFQSGSFSKKYKLIKK
ncbi:MAG: T9SS type A sorting domain-containing protein [Bacteroidota bacterium]|nr:T9SS type A sorting domain-containing protein [Bacteroidota bacterium]